MKAFLRQFSRRLIYYLNSPRLSYAASLTFGLLYALLMVILLINPNAPFDFNIDYLAATALIRGYGPYLADQNPARMQALAQEVHMTPFIGSYYYPPLTAQLIAPLALLPARVAAHLWLGLTILSFIAAAWLLGKSVAHPYSVSLALVMFMNFCPIFITLVAGQINGLMLLALCFALYWLSRRAQVGAGVGIAVAAMLKIVPLAHLAYLGWRRLWKALAAGVIMCVVLFASAIPQIGWQGLIAFFQTFVHKGGSPGLGAAENIALAGFIGYFLGNGTTGLVVWAVASGLVIAVTAAACWPTIGNEHLRATEFGLVTLAANLVPPYAFYHQLALTIIPLFLLVDQAIASRQWRQMGLGLAAYVGLNAAYFAPSGPLAHVSCYLVLLLWGYLASQLIRRKFWPANFPARQPEAA